MYAAAVAAFTASGLLTSALSTPLASGGAVEGGCGATVAGASTSWDSGLGLGLGLALGLGLRLGLGLGLGFA